MKKTNRKAVSDIVIIQAFLGVMLIAIFAGASISQSDYFTERFHQETVDIVAERIAAGAYMIKPHEDSHIEMSLGAFHSMREIDDTDTQETGEYGDGVYIEYDEENFALGHIQVADFDQSLVIFPDADDVTTSNRVCISNDGDEIRIEGGHC